MGPRLLRSRALKFLQPLWLAGQGKDLSTRQPEPRQHPMHASVQVFNSAHDHHRSVLFDQRVSPLFRHLFVQCPPRVRHFALQCFDGGTSIAGFWSKKPVGFSEKPVYSTGITGQSSGCGTCVTPNVCQTTTSVFSIERFCAV